MAITIQPKQRMITNSKGKVKGKFTARSIDDITESINQKFYKGSI